MAIASGVIFPSLGTHAGIPSGFTRETNLDDRYPLGSPASTNPNVTGGSSTHTHATSHTHTVGSHTHAGITSGGPSATGPVTNAGSGGTVADTAHTHTFPTTGSQTATLQDSGSVVTASGSSLPSSYGVIWIKSDGSPAGIPNGREALWSAASPPSGWTGQSGPAGRYLVGSAAAADAGTLSGSATHLHAGVAHTHTISNHAHTIGNTSAPSGTINKNTGALAAASSTHTHTSTISSTANGSSGSATSGNSGSTDIAPAYYKLGVIRNGTGGDSLPTGIIGAWLGTLASIPAMWLLCDGTNGTPDLRDRMVVAAAADLSDVGGTGGATSHDHTDPAGHTHTTSHTHTIQTSGGPSATTNMGGTASNGTTSSHTHSGGASGSGGPTSGSSVEAIASATAYPPYRTVAWLYYSPPAPRTVPATANVQTTPTRTVGATANVQKTESRTVPASANVQVVGLTRTVAASANVQVTSTRPVAASANVEVDGITRTVPASADVQTGRVVPTQANVSTSGNTRTVAASANVQESGTRTVGATGNVQTTGTRTIGASANVKTTPTRTVATSANVEVDGIVRTVSAKANVQETGLTRTTPATANIGETHTRTVPAAAAVAIPLPIVPVVVAPPTAEQVHEALSGLYGDVSVRYRFSRRTRTNGLIDEIEGVPAGGAITLDNSRAVVRDLELVLDLDRLPEDFNLTGDILAVVVEVYVPQAKQWASLQVGLFTLDAAETQYALGGSRSRLVPVRGADLAMLLVQSIRTSAYELPAGTHVIAAVEAILDRHAVSHALPEVSDTLPNAVAWPAGTSEWQICADLMFGVNCFPPTPDAQGVFRSRVRIDPSTETAAVTYRNTAEPMMVSARDRYLVGRDTKLPNRVRLVIDDPRNSGFGAVDRENADPDSPNSTAALAYGDEAAVSTSSVGNPTVITTGAAHGFSDGLQVLITGHEGSVPDINGSHVVTVLSATTFSIPVNVTTAGSGGTVQATSVQLLEFKGDGTPSTIAVIDATKAAEIADYETRWAALQAEPVELATFMDPRRSEREYFAIDLDGIEDSELFGSLGWRLELGSGPVMRHRLGRARAITVQESP